MREVIIKRVTVSASSSQPTTCKTADEKGFITDEKQMASYLKTVVVESRAIQVFEIVN